MSGVELKRVSRLRPLSLASEVSGRIANYGEALERVKRW